jgi:hypothetical protein
VTFKALAALTAFGLGLTPGPPMASAGCTPWDVKDTCCLAGCAAKRGSNWPKADEILRSCMRGLGCSESEVKDATVFMNCDCPEKERDDLRGKDGQSGHESQGDEGSTQPPAEWRTPAATTPEWYAVHASTRDAKHHDRAARMNFGDYPDQRWAAAQSERLAFRDLLGLSGQNGRVRDCVTYATQET